MAPSIYLLCILFLKGFLFVRTIENANDQTGLYFIEEPHDIVAVKGKAVILPCSAGTTRNLKLDLHWLHDGIPIERDLRRHVLANGSLSISKVQHKKNGYSDQGEYKCIISDGRVSLSSRSMYLRIAVMRNFTEHPKSQYVEEGSHVRISCEIDSLPKAVIYWKHDEIRIPMGHPKYLVLSGVSFNGSVLYIFNVSREDSGKYRCMARNPSSLNQQVSKPAVLTVRVRDVDGHKVSRFLTLSRVFTVTEGDDVILDCVRDILQYPTLYWTYKPEGNSNETSVFNSTSTGYNIAYLKSIKRHQSGFYNCRVVDQPSEEMVIEIIVMTRLEFLGTPKSVTYYTARAVRFHCKVQGNPIPWIKWLKDGTPVNISGRISQDTEVNVTLGLRTSELVIASSLASDAGIYQCIAKNAVDMIWAASLLVLNRTETAPRPPQNVTCRTLSSSEIEVQWDVSNEMLDNLIAFTIHYHEMGGSEERRPLQPQQRNISIGNLSPFTNYTFYMRSYIKKIASDFSQQVVCQTHEEVPHLAPEVQLIKLTPHSLYISWTPLSKAQAGGNVTEYEIQWRLKKSSAASSHRVNNEISEYIITDLLPQSEYEVRVLAITSKGLPISDIRWKTFKLSAFDHYVKDSKPIIELKAVNSSTIKVIWNMSDELHTNMTSFKLSYHKGNSHVDKFISLPVNISEYYLTNLESETLYEVTVFGLMGGESWKEARSSVRTPPYPEVFEDEKFLIDPPADLHAKPISRGIINISWIPAPSTVSFISYYTVCYSPVKASYSSTRCLKSEKNSMFVSNLEPYTPYEFKVKSHSHDYKQSAYTEPIRCTTFEDVPGQVVDIQWRAENTTTISASWKKPIRSNGIIRNYTIFYTKTSKIPLASWTKKVVSADTYTTQLTDLMPNMKYSLIIRASTSAGLGSYSDPEQVMIPIHFGVATNNYPQNGKDRRSIQYMGIVVGLGIGSICIIMCVLCVVWKRRCKKAQTAEEIETAAVYRTNGNGCQSEDELRIGSQEAEFFPCISSQGGVVSDESSMEQDGEKKIRLNCNGVKLGSYEKSESSNIISPGGNINITDNPRFDPFYYKPAPFRVHSDFKRGPCDYTKVKNVSKLRNHFELPLLAEEPKPTDAEIIDDKLLYEDKEFELEGKNTTSSSGRQLDVKSFLEPDIGNFPLLESQKLLLSDKCLLKHLTVKENGILENPEFRFSEPVVSDKSTDIQKKMYFLNQKIPSNPLLKTGNGIESTGS